MPAAAVDNITIVQDILGPLLRSADLQPLRAHLADDVTLTVAGPEGAAGPDTDQERGKAAVLDYFASLGDLLKFWRVRYSWNGVRVVVHAEESFIIEPCGLAAQSELALVFGLRDGRITQLLVVEDPPALAGAPDTWQIGAGSWG
jgi:ketosteroid isomerase-like protein